jgi:hypothetical protein
VERNYAELVTSGLLTGDEWAHHPGEPLPDWRRMLSCTYLSRNQTLFHDLGLPAYFL